MKEVLARRFYVNCSSFSGYHALLLAVRTKCTSKKRFQVSSNHMHIAGCCIKEVLPKPYWPIACHKLGWTLFIHNSSHRALYMTNNAVNLMPFTCQTILNFHLGYTMLWTVQKQLKPHIYHKTSRNSLISNAGSTHEGASLAQVSLTVKYLCHTLSKKSSSSF